jgi:hypothetical protein
MAAGGVQIGAPTGGDKGQGALNAEAIYVNGVPVSTGGLTVISDQTLSAATSTISFSSIPGTYRHLRIEFQGREDGNENAGYLRLQFNGDTAADYDVQVNRANGSTPSAVMAGGLSWLDVAMLPGAQSTRTSMAASIDILIPNYASTTFEKSIIASGAEVDSTSANSWIGTSAGSWHSTSAITSITLLPFVGNPVSGTRATLYGF